MSFFKYILFIYTLIKVGFMCAQTNTKNFTINSGLPSNEVYEIKKDKFGQIWIAGDRGVSRFNGNEFKHFDVTNGLSYPLVTTIMDIDGLMTFQQFDGTFIEQNEQNELQEAPYSKIITSTLGINNVVRSYTYNKSYLFLSYYGAGTIGIDRKSNKIMYRSDTTRYSKIGFGVKKREDLIYMEMPRMSFDFTTKETDSLYVELDYANTKKYITLKREKGDVYQCFIRKKSGGFISSPYGYVLEGDALGNFNYYIAPYRVLKIIESEKEELMLAFWKGGLRMYEAHENYSSSKFKTYLNNMSTTGAVYDNENGLWISTHDNGVYYFPKTNYEYEPYLYSKANGANITMMVSDNGLNYTINKHKNYTINDSLKCVDSIDVKNDEVQLKSGSKIFKLSLLGGVEDVKNKTQLFKGLFSTYYIYKNYILFASNALLFIYDTKTNEIYQSPCKFARINSILISDDKLIYGTPFGVYEIQGINNHLKNKDIAREDSKLLFNDVRYKNLYVKDIKEYNSKIYIATIGNGLVIVDKNNIWQLLSKQNGLLSNNIEDMELVGHELFLATNSGINSIDLSTSNYTIRNICITHNFETIDAKKILYFSKHLWVLSSNGIGKIKIDLKEDQIQVKDIPVYFSSISIDNKILPKLSNNVNDCFPYNNASRIEVNFFGVSMKLEGKITYLYRLIGVSDKWKQTNSRNLTFAQLPPGNYKLEIKAINENAKPSNYVAMFNFEIEPPFYKKIWFVGIISLLVVGTIGAIIMVRIKFLRNNINFNLITQKAMVAQINPHFIFNILNSINSDILIEDKRSASKTLVNFSRLMRQNLNNSNQQLVSINDDFEALKYYLILEQNRNNVFDYHISIDKNIDVLIIKVPPMIIQPFVENVMRHAFVKNTIYNKAMLTISLKLIDQNLLCVVQDNGIGIIASMALKQNSNAKKSLGIEITKERIHFLSNYYKKKVYIKIYDLSTIHKQGTCVEFYLPYKINNRNESDNS